MIGKILGTVAASVFSGLVVFGIGTLIASDFGDVSKGVSWAQQIFASAKPGAAIGGKDALMRNADNISFFKIEPIKGTTLQVTTGISFASPEDMVTGKTKKRWCYIMFTSGPVDKRINLGAQTGQSEPIYDDPTRLPESELKAMGLDAARLAAIARSHCYLDGFDPRLSKIPDSKPALSPRLWQKAPIWRSIRKPNTQATT